MSARFPAFRFAFLFLTAYLLLLGFLLQKLKKQGNKRWQHGICLLIVIALFTLAGYGLYFLPSQKKRFGTNSFSQLVITGHHMPAVGKFTLGLYSLNAVEYTLSLGARFYPVTHVMLENTNRKVPNPYVLHEDDSGQQILGVLDKCSHIFFVVNAKFEFPILGQVRRDAQNLRLKIENQTSDKILACKVYVDNRFFDLGDLPAHTVQRKKITGADLNRKHMFTHQDAEKMAMNFYSDDSKSLSKPICADLFENILLKVHAKYKSRRDTMLFIGWIQRGLIQTNVEPFETKGADLTMINWEIPIEMSS
jgi:hypothetical protein